MLYYANTCTYNEMRIYPVHTSQNSVGINQPKLKAQYIL